MTTPSRTVPTSSPSGSNAAGASRPAATRLRVLYSFPNRIGGARICTTAWHQAAGLSSQGCAVTVLTGSVARRLPEARVFTTLSFGRFRLPFRWLGSARMSHWHDRRVARWLRRHGRNFDVVHVWPSGARHTLRVCQQLGLAVVLERPNAHTEFACDAVAAESARLGLAVPAGAEHALTPEQRAWEEAEFQGADFLLCPSDFVARTFAERGYPPEKLLRHQYGCDPARFFPGNQQPLAGRGLVMLYAGLGSPRKGLHHALRAWLDSGAQESGTFLVCGELQPDYRAKLAPLLAHPSVRVLGQRADLPQLLREADLFVLPTVEEGSALVTYEARACGCVLLVSEASGAVCRPGVDARVHAVGDVTALTRDIAELHRDRATLDRLRRASLATRDELTWQAAAARLRAAYQQAFAKVAEAPTRAPGKSPGAGAGFNGPVGR